MPVVTVQLWSGRTVEQKRRLVAAITQAMIDHADVFLFDLQDLGCRIYTFVTTLLYLLEAVSGTGKAVWVLDRPNPAGRPVEGTKLLPGHESFVGAGPMPMRAAAASASGEK